MAPCLVRPAFGISDNWLLAQSVVPSAIGFSRWSASAMAANSLRAGFQVFHDLAGNYVGRQQTVGVIEAWVPDQG